MGSCVREVESGTAINEIEVERLRELALEQQEVIEILRQAVKVMEFSQGGRHESRLGKTHFSVFRFFEENVVIATYYRRIQPNNFSNLDSFQQF